MLAEEIGHSINTTLYKGIMTTIQFMYLDLIRRKIMDLIKINAKNSLVWMFFSIDTSES